MIEIICISLVLVYLVLNVAKVAVKNHKAQTFFQRHGVDFPVLPNSGLFGGHFKDLIYTDNNSKMIAKLHDKYGPTFGYYMCDQPWISTKDVELIKTIEVDEAHLHINRAHLYSPVDEFANSIFQSRDNRWRKNRQAVAPPLRNNVIRGEVVTSDIEFVMEKFCEAMEEKLSLAEKKTGSKKCLIDVDDSMQRIASATVFAVAFAQRNIIDFKAETDKLVNTIRTGLKGNPSRLMALAFLFNSLTPILRFLIQFQKIGSLFKDLAAFMTKALEDSKRESEQAAKNVKPEASDKKRMIEVMAEEVVKKNITYNDFKDNMVFMLLAGYVTTADAATSMIWHLARNPEIQEKLRKTLTEEGIDAEYVTWVIMETVRWHPSVPLHAGRVLGQDVTVNGKTYPKGAYVMPSTWAIHHDSKIWPNADAFNPDRWRNRQDMHLATFMGFGLGPRNCPGYYLAVHELRLILKGIFTRYRIEACSETPDQYNYSGAGILYCNLLQPIQVMVSPISQKSS